MTTLRADKLSTGAIACTVTHHESSMIWRHTISDALTENKTYARWDVNPDIEIRLRCIDGGVVVETHHRRTGEVYQVSPSPGHYQFTPATKRPPR